jgi:putative acyl-CoA dehydrogenase
VPRILEDGSLNGLRLQRLKDKLGNRSNASSEVEFSDTYGFLLGGEGEGVRTILDMVTLTRLDCALASAGMMRASLAEAVHHCRHRRVFGELLIDQPLMARVLADLALETAAGTALSLRLARAFDNARDNPAEAAIARLMTPVVKYWVCKIAPSVIYEVMECMGGNGYVEERAVARHYREAPGQCDLGRLGQCHGARCAQGAHAWARSLRSGARQHQPRSGRCRSAHGGRPARLYGRGRKRPGAGRLLTEQLALAAAAAELTRLGAGHVAEAFVETRLGGAWRVDLRHARRPFRRAPDRRAALPAGELSRGNQPRGPRPPEWSGTMRLSAAWQQRRRAVHLHPSAAPAGSRSWPSARGAQRQYQSPSRRIEPEAERQRRP